MQKQRVSYLMSGQAHLPYLVCSLYTLRKYWDGEIVLCAWPESFDIVEKIASDSKLNITDVRKREPDYRGKNDQFMDKIKMVQGMENECDVVLYLDADTTIHGDITPILETGFDYGFAATQWNNWQTFEGMPKRRIQRLRDFSEIDVKYINALSEKGWPSVNGGVWAASPKSPVLTNWYSWTELTKSIFIADETVLHVLVSKYVPKNKMRVLCDYGKWNHSPKRKFQSVELDDNDIVIMHYHGDSNVRPKKSQRGFNKWWPLYQQCLKNNVGKMSDWIGEINNKHLTALENDINKQPLVNWC